MTTPPRPPRENEYEVWVNDTLDPPYLLIMAREAGGGGFRITDPQKGNEEVLSAADFLEIIDYLCEEDYELVRGRMEIDKRGDEDDE